MSVQKQVGQWTKFKAFVAIGDYNGHVGPALAIRGSIILAKLSTIPVWRGYLGKKIGKLHTVPFKVTGYCGSVLYSSFLSQEALALSLLLCPRNY
ncbi:hypothetical protein A6R68_11877 [Neotoma lepida]|uniref:S5 DRBM domain-containing protein n=1 Tax=Neotoma lepida TaxID=56216 RepID=A0A1A6FSR5_NEOLE|nr:hypothetical protein A6R68_11877 [Neotoma lepida]